MSAVDPKTTPAGEEIHLPGPSYQPLLLAVGITIILLGVTTSPFIVAAGLILTVTVFVRWILDTKREMAELPADHSAH